METENYIINDVEPMDASSKVKEVQMVFNQLTYTHIPVEKDGQYIGCISENDAYCFDNDKLLSDFQYALEPYKETPIGLMFWKLLPSTTLILCRCLEKIIAIWVIMSSGTL